MKNDDLSDDDKILFRQAVQTIKPLKMYLSEKYVVDKTTTHQLKKDNQVRNKNLTHNAIYLSNHYTDEVNVHATLSFCANNLSKKRWQALRLGQISWQSRLDLHGYHVSDAQVALVKFIINAYEASYRCVLVIHGKGGLNGNAPVLKNLVNYWLPQLDCIIAFHSALPKDGGTGALYVLLKRNLSAISN